MSKPAAKRLLDIITRRRLKSKLIKFLPTVGRFGTLKKSATAGEGRAAAGGARPSSPASSRTKTSRRGTPRASCWASWVTAPSAWCAGASGARPPAGSCRWPPRCSSRARWPSPAPSRTS